VEIACPVKGGSKWSLGRCIYVMPQTTRLPAVTCAAHAAVMSADKDVTGATSRAVSQLIHGHIVGASTRCARLGMGNRRRAAVAG